MGVFQFDPFSIIESDVSATGLFPELIKEIVKDESWTVTFVPGTWAEGLERLQSEKIDLMICVAYTEERDQVMDYNFQSVVELWGQVFVREEDQSVNIDDLQGRRIGVMNKDISASNFVTTAESLGVTCEIITYGSHDDVFEAVEKGEVYAGVAPQHFGLRNASSYYLVPSSILFSPFSIYFTTKQGRHAELLSHIDAHLVRWKEDKDSYYYRSITHWIGGKGYGIAVIPRWLFVILGGVLVLAMIFILFTIFLKKEVRKKTEQYTKSHRQYENLVKSANSIIIRVDRKGRVLFVNKFGLDFFGLTSESSLLVDSETFFTPRFISSILEFPEQRESYEHVELKTALSTGAISYIKWSNTVLWDQQGELDEILCIGVDMTSSRLMEAKLRQSDKLSAIGQLAGGVAHDFNNQLLAIMGFAELLDEQLEGELKEYTQSIMDSARRSADLTKKLLSFARKGQVVLVELNLKNIIMGVVDLFQRGINKNITIQTLFSVQDPVIMGDPSQLENALLNLLINARDAMPSGGEIRITIDQIRLSRGIKSFHEKVKSPGEYIKVSIADEGTGISEENQERVFEPFFTTKDQGKGTGMGLASVYGAVKEHRGYIHFESIPEEGTTFELYFPLVKKS